MRSFNELKQVTRGDYEIERRLLLFALLATVLYFPLQHFGMTQLEVALFVMAVLFLMFGTFIVKPSTNEMAKHYQVRSVVLFFVFIGLYLALHLGFMTGFDIVLVLPVIFMFLDTLGLYRVRGVVGKK